MTKTYPIYRKQRNGEFKRINGTPWRLYLVLALAVLASPYILDAIVDRQLPMEGYTSKERASMSDLHAEAMEEHQDRHKPFGDMQAAAFVFGITESNINSFMEWW